MIKIVKSKKQAIPEEQKRMEKVIKKMIKINKKQASDKIINSIYGNITHKKLKDKEINDYINTIIDMTVHRGKQRIGEWDIIMANKYKRIN